MNTRNAIGSGMLVACVLALAGCGGGLNEMKSYESLPVGPTRGRDACAVEAEQRGDSSSGYAVGGWALGATTVGLAAAPAILVTKDEVSKSDRYIAPALLVGSVITGALSYVFFDRSDAHAKAAATSQSAVIALKDSEAYSTCVEARSLVYSSRKDSNHLATSKLLEQQGKQATANADLGAWYAADVRARTAEAALQVAKDDDSAAQLALQTAQNASTGDPTNLSLKAQLTAAQDRKAATTLALTQATDRRDASLVALKTARTAVDPK